jgi:hypothetical protein
MATIRLSENALSKIFNLANTSHIRNETELVISEVLGKGIDERAQGIEVETAS